MKLIRRYIAKQLGNATFFSLLALLGLYTFFNIITEVSKIGEGSYTTLTMFAYVSLLLPGQAYQLMPLAVLIGGMIAMTGLASHSEYTVIRTSGISTKQIAWLLTRFGLFFALLTLLLGEVVAPYTEQKAEKLRLNAINAQISQQDYRSGIWIKDNNHLINIAEMLPDNTLRNIRAYKYNDQHELSQSIAAESATYIENGKWLIKNVKVTDIEENKTHAQTLESVEWKSVIKPEILDVLLVVPEQMSAINLITYIRHLNENKQETQRYDIALWSKFFYPLACVSMALVALAFTPQQRRQGQLGTRLFFGICLGVGFHFINRFFAHLGLLYAWNPTLSATLPTALFLIGGLWVIKRQEKR